jgi:hypothetical protein
LKINPGAHQYDIERFILSHPSFKGINRQATIFRNLNGMTILFKNFDCQFLVNKIVLREKDVEGNIIWRRDRADGIGFQSRDEGRRKVLPSDRSSNLRTDAIV